MTTFTIKHENDEYDLRFERRRYGSTTFTWAYVRLGAEWLSLGDPWPCVTPKRTELIREAVRVIGEHFASASPQTAAEK